MGTSTPLIADSEPGMGESRVSVTSGKSSRSCNLKANASKKAGCRPLRGQGIAVMLYP